MNKRARVGIGGRLTFREQLVRLWRADPTASCREVKARTGAPHNVVKKVRRDLVAQGLLKPGADKLWAY